MAGYGIINPSRQRMQNLAREDDALRRRAAETERRAAAAERRAAGIGAGDYEQEAAAAREQYGRRARIVGQIGAEMGGGVARGGITRPAAAARQDGGVAPAAARGGIARPGAVGVGGLEGADVRQLAKQDRENDARGSGISRGRRFANEMFHDKLAEANARWRGGIQPTQAERLESIRQGGGLAIERARGDAMAHVAGINQRGGIQLANVQGNWANKTEQTRGKALTDAEKIKQKGLVKAAEVNAGAKNEIATLEQQLKDTQAKLEAAEKGTGKPMFGHLRDANTGEWYKPDGTPHSQQEAQRLENSRNRLVNLERYAATNRGQKDIRKYLADSRNLTLITNGNGGFKVIKRTAEIPKGWENIADDPLAYEAFLEEIMPQA